MNLPLCLWLWSRAVINGDHLEVMVHEPFLVFGEGSWRQNLAAVVHRLMAILQMSAAQRVWVSIPAWERCLHPYALGRRVSIRWLPIPSNVPVTASPHDVVAVRAKVAPNGEWVIGHFGTYGRHIAAMLGRITPVLFDAEPRAVLLLLGSGAVLWRDRLLLRYPNLSKRICATGPLDREALSSHIAACDLLVQPYPDGISTRRGTAMAGLSHGKTIVTNAGHLTEAFWAESGVVSLTPLGNVQAMAQAASWLLNHPEDRAVIGNAAAALYARRFETAHTIAALRNAAAQDAG